MKRSFVPYYDALEMALNLLNFRNTVSWYAAGYDGLLDGRIDRAGAGWRQSYQLNIRCMNGHIESGTDWAVFWPDQGWCDTMMSQTQSVATKKWNWWNCLTWKTNMVIFIDHCLLIVQSVCGWAVQQWQCSVQEVETVCLHVVTISPSVPQYLSCYMPTLYWTLSSGPMGGRIITVTPQHPFIPSFVMLHGKFILMLWLHKSCSHTLHVSALCLSLKGFLYNANIIRRGRYGDLNGVVMTGSWDLYVS